MIFRWKIMSEGVSAAASVGRLARPTGAQRPLAGGVLTWDGVPERNTLNLSGLAAQSACRPLASATAVGHGQRYPPPTPSHARAAPK